DGLASNVPARGVTAGVPGDLLARPGAQVVLEPVAVHGRSVPDQPEHGGQGGYQAPPGVLLGQAAKLSAQRLAVVLEKSLQGLPLSGYGDQVFICQWRGGFYHQKATGSRNGR